ncbi:exonuclease, DNA polymerase III, epsilon subunit family [Capnocytophaga ochracea F0287]|uniref:Exonuclease, DNA polymerase III, epsilon subunit family n=1 Tax=Capnocytophaga ochracea F0287 TaxID=873517 RepID=E4MRG8_CAPOC|nr:exonuclease domain-containing protein [Capnocytophaga ochracea]EFS97709.1 exonuclease, DNA polymerase III, epsilon subunit family [Capnocytophaga ochracea F0287]EJF44242.1 exonuclease [Capnocytophaga ochracea str. Holt 25]UEB43947.1 exonuclease [Capnocytophaga ochracea]
MYAILDIETTGGKYNEEGITDIAIYQFNGHEITDQFISLINPERPIQEFVTKLTGINNKMLRNAPKFYEVAKRIVEITTDCIIVGHNAAFDYRILQTEFRRLGYDFVRTTLCTVELSERLIPNKESYSLGKLVRSLGIPVSDRHRASGDALATLKLFKYLLEKDTKKDIITTSVKQDIRLEMASRHLKILDTLPETLGIFYMHNEEGKVIYIGKHKNIKQQVNRLFTSPSKRDKYLQRHTYRVTYQETGNELIATLKRLEEIHLNLPKCNRRNPEKEINITYALTSHFNTKGYLCFSIELLSTQNEIITTFETKEQAEHFLNQITEEYHLNEVDFNNETVEEYNSCVSEVLSKYGLVHRNVAIVDKGRVIGEKSIILVVDGNIQGYAFFNLNFQLTQLEMLQNLITPLPNSLTNRHLLHAYLRRKPKVKVLNLSEQKPYHNE